LITFLTFAVENFRALKSIDLSFENHEEGKPLTVFRATNESGKTTLMTALAWTVFGDNSLPGGSARSRRFRMSPIDWNIDKSGSDVSIITELRILVSDEEATAFDGKSTEILIRRQAVERLVNKKEFSRQKSTVKLYRATDTGDDEIRSGESILSQLFPSYLHDVFFTDGDTALNFIASGTQSDRRSRVENSIRTLLGLELLDSARSHVGAVERELNKSLQGMQDFGDAARLAEEIENLQEKIDQSQSDITKSYDEETASNQKVIDLNSQLEEALILGNKEALVERKNTLTAESQQLNESVVAQKGAFVRLLERSEIGFRLLEPTLEIARKSIDQLYESGTIPRNFLPILKERLEMGVCVCGSPLHEKTEQYQHILDLIDEEMKRGESHVAERLTHLRHSDMGRREDQQFGPGWISDYLAGNKTLGISENRQAEIGRELRNIQTQIDAITDDKVPQLRTLISTWISKRNEAHDQRLRSEHELRDLTRTVEERKRERDASLAMAKAGKMALANAQVVSDVKQVIDSAIELIRQQKVNSVSETMNSMFMEMIRSDPENGLIRRSQISDDFDIQVFGPQDRTLETDTDLNGASRRALTYSFVLALTQESDFDSPVFIDTPLGMTDGVVRENIINVTASSLRPTVLFLTRAEISGIEDLLDEQVGTFMTMTNMTHSNVVNRDDESEIIKVCVCSHREYCSVCERDGDDANRSLVARET